MKLETQVLVTKNGVLLMGGAALGVQPSITKPADLAGKTIAIYDDPAAERWVRDNIPRATIRKFSGDDGWFEAVEKGQAAALIYDYPFAVEEVKPFPRLKIVKLNLNASQYAVGVPVRNDDLLDAVNEALRDWMSSVATTHYILGSVVGPHPFPRIVRDFQAVIGRETIEQSRAQIGRLPNTVVACVGGGSNAAGMFYPFVEHKEVALVGVEAGGRSDQPGDHAAPLTFGQPGVLHGSYSYVMQDADGQTCDVHSMSAGLDYPGVGPEHSYWKDTGRVTYVSATDKEALAAFQLCTKLEGIIPALESAHAIAWLIENPVADANALTLVCLSGRGDKDLAALERFADVEPWAAPER